MWAKLNISARKKNDTSGFTIVELLIVIVVIGILAAIVVVAYNGAQQRARDVRRQANVNDIAIAIQSYNITNGNTVGNGSGCGRNGAGSGWFNYNGSNSVDNSDTTYTRSILECLISAGLLNTQVTDPSGWVAYAAADPIARYAYMKYDCIESGSNVTYILARLENPATPALNTATMCATVQTAVTNYKLNYTVRLVAS